MSHVHRRAPNFKPTHTHIILRKMKVAHPNESPALGGGTRTRGPAARLLLKAVPDVSLAVDQLGVHVLQKLHKRHVSRKLRYKDSRRVEH